MLTKKYEVCLIDRNKFDDILHKAISSMSPIPKVEVEYGRGNYFSELNGYSINNIMHINFKYKLPIVISDIIVRKLNDMLQNCEYINNISVGYQGGSSGNTTILIVFNCEVFDPSWDY